MIDGKVIVVLQPLSRVAYLCAKTVVSLGTDAIQRGLARGIDTVGGENLVLSNQTRLVEATESVSQNL